MSTKTKPAGKVVSKKPALLKPVIRPVKGSFPPKMAVRMVSPKKDVTMDPTWSQGMNTVGVSKGWSGSAHFEVKQGKYPDSIIIRGQDFLAFANGINAVVPSGTILANILISPYFLGGTRLSAYANLYEKFRFRKLRFLWTSASPTSTSGSAVLSYDRDVSDATPPANAVGLQQLLGSEGAKVFPVWDSCGIECDLDYPEDGFFTNLAPGSDERLVYQGQLYLSAFAALSSIPTTQSYGSLWYQYEIEFFVPQLENQVVQGSATNTPSSTPSQTDAWAAFTNSPSGKILTQVLQNGKTGMKLPPGVYELIQSAVSATATGGLQYSTPFLQGLSTSPNGQTPSQVNNLESFSTPAAAASTLYRRDQVTVTDPLGALLWGAWNGASALTSQKLTITKIAATLLGTILI
jgi:hypothetical protein